MGPVPDSLLLRKCGMAGNRIRDFYICKLAAMTTRPQKRVHHSIVTFSSSERYAGNLRCILDTSKENSVRLEVFTAVTVKNGVLWDVTSCGSRKNRRLGGT
jgi:hypothetical protein